MGLALHCLALTVPNIPQDVCSCVFFFEGWMLWGLFGPVVSNFEPYLYAHNGLARWGAAGTSGREFTL